VLFANILPPRADVGADIMTAVECHNRL